MRCLITVLAKAERRRRPLVVTLRRIVNPFRTVQIRAVRASHDKTERLL